MNASKTRHATAVEPDLEPANPDLLVGDDEFDVEQDSAEHEFFQHMIESRQRRFGRSARQAW